MINTMDDFWWYIFCCHIFSRRSRPAPSAGFRSPALPHRVWRCALGPTGVGAGRFQHAKEAVEEKGRGDGAVHEKTQ